MWNSGSQYEAFRFISVTLTNFRYAGLRTDPQESRSVADLHPEIAAEMSERLAAHRQHDLCAEPTMETAQKPHDAIVLERLRALGYVE